MTQKQTRQQKTAAIEREAEHMKRLERFIVRDPAKLSPKVRAMHETYAMKSALRRAGYRATLPRLAVLRVFESAKRPPSAQDVIDAVRNGMDSATVYRTLKSLKEKGMIRQVDLRHNHAHYELTGAPEHHHLICSRCGRMEEVRDCGGEEMEKLVLRHSKHFAEIREHALEFYGVCKSCAHKNGPSAAGLRKDASL
ncbi:MAG TPA: Fur family transcriptional regulator [Candidatus Paceibacterota bacterium]|nr:Fur family transcriptional regulator [Candidatus Paceibacterota bacterium]